MMIKELIRQYKYYFIEGGILGAAALLAVIFMLFNQSGKTQTELAFHEGVTNFTSDSFRDNQATSQEKKEQDSELFVDVKGAVNKPGMYEAQGKMRVWDAVGLAGGVQENADTKQVNFSQRISDQMVIYIPVVGEVLPETETAKEVANENSQSEAADSDKVELNKASETELQTLTGIGQKKAQEIIRYREENGGFKSIEDLKNISGFGEKTIEKLKEQITVS